MPSVHRDLWQGLIVRYLWRGSVVGLYLGRGERPERVLFVAILIFLGTTLGYWLGGSFGLHSDTALESTGRPSFTNAAYFSGVSFTALGYGSAALEPTGWAQGVGAAESVLGIFSVVFFSITFAQRVLAR